MLYKASINLSADISAIVFVLEDEDIKEALKDRNPFNLKNPVSRCLSRSLEVPLGNVFVSKKQFFVKFSEKIWLVGSVPGNVVIFLDSFAEEEFVWPFEFSLNILATHFGKPLVLEA